MRLAAPLLAALLLALLGSGCAAPTGLIYSRVTEPWDVNLDRTPVYDEQARDSRNVFRYYVRFEWGNEGLAETARRHGLTTIYYADRETLSVLGIWTQRWAHVYGER